MSAQLPPLLQNAGVPLDLFIQALTEQLDKAQAAMTIKARVGKLPLTFAVKDVSLDLRVFVQMLDDDVYLRPAGPGESEASTVRLALTTITKPMIEENAADFRTDEADFSLRSALGDQFSDEEQRQFERIGVRTVAQLNELKDTAGADVIARLSRMPVNRLQQALLRAAAPRVTHVQAADTDGAGMGGTRVHLTASGLHGGRRPVVRAAGVEVPIVSADDGSLVLAPLAMQLGCDAQLDFDDGRSACVPLRAGSLGQWSTPA